MINCTHTHCINMGSFLCILNILLLLLVIAAIVAPSDFFPQPEMVEERGLARPVVAGIVATICFLAAAVLFSTMAACFVNKQRRRKLKRKRGEEKHLELFINISSVSYQRCS